MTETQPATAEAAPAPRRAGRPPNARMQAAKVRPDPEREEVRPDTPRLQRKRRRTEDRFHIDPAIIPPGISWEWKAEKVLGQSQEHHMMWLSDNHFKPVDQDKYPNLVTRMDGMVLMERPIYLTREARQEDLQIALDQVRSVQNTVGDTPTGTMTRNHPSAKAHTGVRRGYDLAIPGDEANYQEPT